MTNIKPTPDSTNGPEGSIILYQTEDGRTRIDCRFENETIWLTQALIAELFQTSKQNISLHVQNILDEGELQEDSVVKEYLTTAADGKQYSTKHYALAIIIAVGYRVRSPRGTQFRQWATARLSEFLVKGFTMDDERLKNPPLKGSGVPDYFDELLARIRDIRASEKRVYLRVKEILALAADYTSTAPDTQVFFQTIQNKLHFAATGATAPEIIAQRADASKPNMGLTSWKSGIVRKGDVTIAKNYLTADEIEALNRIVVMFLDYAEDQAKRRKQVFLADWQTKLDDFLRFNDREVLPDAGKVSREAADKLAEAEYTQFADRRRIQIENDAEQDMMKELEEKSKKLPKKANDQSGKFPKTRGDPQA